VGKLCGTRLIDLCGGKLCGTGMYRFEGANIVDVDCIVLVANCVELDFIV
jgi:hypothetical protein